MPNVMDALPNIGGALCSTPQSLADATTRVPCSNATKTRNPLAFAGVPQTRQQISAVSWPKFTILSRHVEEIFLLNNFFPIVDTHISDMQSKFALRPHHVWKYGRHPISDC